MRQSAVNTELFKSTLIAGVLPDCDSTRPRKILDFGEAQASTIAHLQRTFWGRLTVLDLISQAPEINALLSDDEASEQRAAVL